MTESIAYRVVAPMVQVVANYKTHKNAAIERQFRAGDALPEWVPEKELHRLRELGFIEAVA